ncbi:hypothetical protein IEN85_09960 [Pelagicoccus sp. NFK12]|uniref:Uncharacterized protein n=1 Tax=Pelagicoccus enzymogenes TaxID=2773457 RepID=A0A927IF75_9BACT|nr:hypothetical protein [Pelagicoccus enzymogenes]MBD5779817.1 hypothetical protein [Pelagicoccus enzymogenes]
MKTTLQAFLLFCIAICSARGDRALLPNQPSCYALAVSANELIALGEEGAKERLKEEWTDSGKNGDLFAVESARERLGWLSRILYLPGPNGIRQPLFGGLGLPWNTMDHGDWPLYPLVESSGIFFVLADGYVIAGLPEDPIAYLHYCGENGTFRTAPLKVPNEAEAMVALEELLESKEWNSIKWKDSKWHSQGGGFEYEFDKSERIKYLKKQTEFDR